MDKPLSAKSIAAALCALAAVPALAAETWTGAAYLADGGALAYRETHYRFGAERLVVYACPDGRPFARKTILENGIAQAPDFSLRDARWGYREGVRGSGETREA